MEWGISGQTDPLMLDQAHLFFLLFVICSTELASRQSASELASLLASVNRLVNWPPDRPLASLSACFPPEKNQASLPASGQ